MSGEVRSDAATEEAVLKSVILGGVGALDVCREAGLRSEHFWQTRNEAVYAAAERLADQGLGLDLLSLLGSLPEQERVRAGFWLPELVTGGVGAAPGMLAYHAKLLVELAGLRRLAEAGRETVRLSEAAPADRLQEALERARAALDAVDADEELERQAVRLSEALEPVIESAEQGRSLGLPTGFPALDAMLSGGPTAGQSLLIGARPSVGKTMLACNLARNVARSGRSVVFFSLEMTREELGERFLSMESGVPLKRIREGALREQDWEKIARATSAIATWPLLIDDRSNVTVGDMRARLRKLSRRGEAPALVISDYAQIVRAANARVDREQQVSAISAGIKAMAKDFRTVAVTLAQLNRGSEQRRNQAPLLRDLRESGALEQDADVVVLMHYDPKRPEQMGLAVAKNRQGEKGTFSLVWQPSVMRAMPYEREQEQEAMWDARMQAAGE